MSIGQKQLSLLKRVKQKGKKIIKEINTIEIPIYFKRWLKKYKEIGGKKDDFFWKWSLWTIRRTSFFPKIKKYYTIPLERGRFMLNMYVILLDEISESRNTTNLLNKLMKIPFAEQYKSLETDDHYFGGKEKEYLKFAISIWRQFEKELRNYPRRKKFEGILRFNIIQIVNSLYYDHIVNENPYLISMTGSWLYSPYSTQVISTFILNSMCSEYPIRDFGLLMSISWEAQRMMRTGNWLGTWEREIREGDFTSAVFSYVIENKIIAPKNIEDKNRNYLINKVKKSEAEKYLLQEWIISYNKLKKLLRDRKIYKDTNINLKRFLKTLEDFLVVDLIAKENR